MFRPTITEMQDKLLLLSLLLLLLLLGVILTRENSFAAQGDSLGQEEKLYDVLRKQPEEGRQQR